MTLREGPEGNHRQLWSERHGRGPNAEPLKLDQAKRIFGSIVDDAQRRDWLQESIGYWCVDAGEVSGKLGSAVAEAILLDTGRGNGWPIDEHIESWDEDTLFDMVEYLFDHVSEGVQEPHLYHSYGGCGWHYEEFVAAPAQRQYRAKVNRFLGRIGEGFWLSDEGIIERMIDPDLSELVKEEADATPLPATDQELIRRAVVAFRSRDLPVRRDAVRNLADVLEHHRSDIKDVFPKKDEAALFEIANKFWIRHNKPGEFRNYDHDAWWDWLFWLYLSSIRLIQRLERRAGDEASS